MPICSNILGIFCHFSTTVLLYEWSVIIWEGWKGKKSQKTDGEVRWEILATTEYCTDSQNLWWVFLWFLVMFLFWGGFVFVVIFCGLSGWSCLFCGGGFWYFLFIWSLFSFFPLAFVFFKFFKLFRFVFLGLEFWWGLFVCLLVWGFVLFLILQISMLYKTACISQQLHHAISRCNGICSAKWPVGEGHVALGTFILEDFLCVTRTFLSL